MSPFLAFPARLEPPTVDQARPWLELAMIVLGALAMLLLARLLVAGWRGRHQIAWRGTLRLIGWLPFALTAAVILLLLTVLRSDDRYALVMPAHVLEMIGPLAMALQAAFLFAPDSEPPLEILLAVGRPPAFLLLERFGLVLLIQTAVAFFGAALTAAIMPDTQFAGLILRWLAPSLILSAVAILGTLGSRSALLGMMLAILSWIILSLFAGAFLPGTVLPEPLNYIQPFAWAIHPYIPPEALSRSDYLLNRALTIIVGILLLAFAIHRLRDTERLLSGLSARRTSQGEDHE